MENFLIKLIFLTFLVNLVRSFPTSIVGNSEKSVNTVESGAKLHNVTVEAIMERIVSPSDTESQKEAKKLIAQYLVALVSQMNSPAPSKSAKSEKNHATPLEQDKIRETIIAALIAAKDEDIGYSDVKSLRAGKQLAVEQIPTDSSNKLTTPKSKPTELTTEQTPAETRPTNSIDKHQAQIINTINNLANNVNTGNITGVVDNGLKVASLETLGVALNNFLNIVLCNPLDRIRGECQSTNTKKRW